MPTLQDTLSVAIQDRYRLDRELGRGGMATVYLGQDLRQGRPVAIKVLRPELTGLLARERFLREIRIASNLHHPHIMPLFDSGAVGDSLYYVMPYLEGESLRERLAREKQLPLDDAITLTREVADALDYAHREGVVHRDIKPGNILLSGGHAVVADFGVARAVTAAGGSDLTTAGLALGTPSYMSPEQAGAEGDVDGRSDVYSLGCVVYEMLVGEPPFTGATPQAVLARHMNTPPRAMRSVRPTITEELDRVVGRALAKVRADRYPTAGRFARAIEQARTSRGLRVRWRVAAPLALVVLVLAGLGWGMLGTRPRLDPNWIVIFPLAEIAPEDRRAGLGEASAVLLEGALDHTEPLSWIDGWQHLDRAQREDPRLLTAAVARRVTRARGARWFLTGSMVARGESTTVVLRLTDAAGDSLVRQASATAAADAAPMAGLRIINDLLVPILSPGRQVDVSSLADRRPAAVVAWLQGEREYRRGNFDAALAHLRRAVGDDSALAVAAVRGAQAASWKSLTTEAEALAGVALVGAALLPPRQAQFSRGLAHYLAGRADSAVIWLTRSLQESTRWPEAHMVLGEVYHHLLPDAPLPLDSLAGLEFAAAAADTGFAPPLFHLAELALRRGRIAEADRLGRRFEGAGSSTEERDELRLMLACVRDGAARVDWTAEARASPAVVLGAAKMLAVGGAYPECAGRAARALLREGTAVDFHFGAFVLLQHLMAARRDGPGLAALIDSMGRAGFAQAGVTARLVDAVAGVPGFDRQPLTAIAELRDAYGSAYEDSLDAGRLLLLGTWHARQGHMGDAERIALRLRASGADLEHRALDGHLALARGDSAGALAALEHLAPAARRDALTWGPTDALPAERLTVAALLHAKGRYADALRVAEVFDHPSPVAYLAFLPASLALRARSAEASGQRARAARYRERLTALGGAELLNP
jgi:tetratricopeptide (TPR) repeat protein